MRFHVSYIGLIQHLRKSHRKGSKFRPEQQRSTQIIRVKVPAGTPRLLRLILPRLCCPWLRRAQKISLQQVWLGQSSGRNRPAIGHLEKEGLRRHSPNEDGQGLTRTSFAWSLMQSTLLQLYGRHRPGGSKFRPEQSPHQCFRSPAASTEPILGCHLVMSSH